ncbi:MAG: efflux RND transporter permease subunit [Methylococcales bacterium]
MSFPNLSALAVRERSLTLFFIMLSVVAGIYAFLSLGRAEDPDFTVRVMVVSVVWPGASAEQLQYQVVDRLEKRIQEVENLYKIESTIRPGRADLQIEFEDYTPKEKIPDLLYQVRKRMQDEAPKLPKGVIGPIVNDDFSDVYFSLMSVTAPDMPLRELTRFVEKIRDRLQQVEGAQKAMIIGERPERIFIEFDRHKLANLGISAKEIFDAIENNNELVSAGFIELSGPRAYIRLDADLSDPLRLAQVPIHIGKHILPLSDLAKISRGYEDPPNFIVRAYAKDAILLGVVMHKGENGLAFGQRLGEFVKQEQEKLPLGITMSVLTDQTDAISGAVNLFQKKFFIAVLVVMVVSILAIGFRAGLVVGIAVPLTLGLTFLLMKITGINLDRITLGALIIALGLLVDDAIIAIEMMIVKIEEGWSRVSAASHAWNVTAAPMLFGTLVTVVGFVPIGFAQSGVGEYAGNIFWVLAYALIISWGVAVTFTPYLGVKILPELKNQNNKHHDLYNSARYQKLRNIIGLCVNYRKTVVATTVILLILSGLGMAKLVEKQFFPNSDRPEVLVNIYLPQGSAIATTDAVTRRIEAILNNRPEVKTLSAYVGAGAPRFFLSLNPEQPDPAFAKIIAIGHTAADRDIIINVLNEHIANGEFPEARVRVTRLVVGPPVLWPVSFRIVGEDPLKIREIAHNVLSVMKQNPNTIDPHLESDERSPVFFIKMDTNRLRQMGLTPKGVAQQLQFTFNGIPVTQVRQDIRTVEVYARGIKNKQFMPSAIEIKTQDGKKIPLTQIADIEISYEEPIIKRYNRERALAVMADVKGAQPPDVTMAIWKKLDTIVKQLPSGYRIDIAGSVEKSVKANLSIQKLQPVMFALMLIFIMLQMRSFSGMFIVLFTAPLGLIGAVMALLLFNQPFGFVALLGLTGLAGILMRNTMILTQQVQDNIEEGLDALTAVIEAAVHRARPVILTAIAAVFAFIPLTSDSFWGPLAYVLIGGVAVGTIITLLFVPALYALWFKLARK